MAPAELGTFDHLPGLDRERGRHGSFPTSIGEMISGLGNERFFPFESWAADARFPYPKDALPFLRGCGSAAEAFFVGEFVRRPGVRFQNALVALGSDEVRLQVPVWKYRADVVVSRGRFKLACEIDGMAFHHRSADAVAADYLRQRRITCAGYTVVRFTAKEVFAGAVECWRQVDAILEANS